MAPTSSIYDTSFYHYGTSAFHNHEGTTCTEKNQSKHNYQNGPKESNHHLLQLCTAHTAWSDTDHAARAVHSCNCWFLHIITSFHSLELLKGCNFQINKFPSKAVSCRNINDRYMQNSTVVKSTFRSGNFERFWARSEHTVRIKLCLSAQFSLCIHALG